jgi:hypothetical protein
MLFLLPSSLAFAPMGSAGVSLGRAARSARAAAPVALVHEPLALSVEPAQAALSDVTWLVADGLGDGVVNLVLTVVVLGFVAYVAKFALDVVQA